MIFQARLTRTAEWTFDRSKPSLQFSDVSADKYYNYYRCMIVADGKLHNS